MDYLRYSKKRKLEADKILQATNLFNRLKEFGKVKQVGSYVLDLMVKPDLDFVLRVKKKSEIDKTIKKIKEMSKDIDKVSFKKVVDREKLGLYGKSIHLHYYSKDIWGIDILVTIKDFKVYNELSRKVKNKIIPKKRRDIIKLKYYFYKNKKKVKNIPYCIYVSVLEGKVSNLKELYEYLDK